MKNLKKNIGFSLLTILLLSSCSTVKISDTWKEVNPTELKEKNVLVVTQSKNFTIRERFESDLTNQLNQQGIQATESYKQYPNLKPVEQGSPEELEKVAQSIKTNGYDVVVMSVLRDIEEYTTTVTSGTTYSVQTLPAYYPRRGPYRSFYRGFNTVYVEGGPYETTTSNNKKYIVETMVYDLTKEEDEQLLSIITSTIENPESLGTTSKDFSKKVMKQLTK